MRRKICFKRYCALAIEMREGSEIKCINVCISYVRWYYRIIIIKIFCSFLSLEKQVSETMKRAFWDAFQEKIERDPPDYSMAFSLLEELKEV